MNLDPDGQGGEQDARTDSGSIPSACWGCCTHRTGDAMTTAAADAVDTIDPFEEGQNIDGFSLGVGLFRLCERSRASNWLKCRNVIHLNRL